MTQPLDYASRGRRASHKSPWWSWLFLLLAIGLLVFMLWPSGLGYRRPNIPYCGSNLRQIALACIIYSNQHHNRFPDSLATLYPTSDLGAEAFICPSTDDRYAKGPTTRAVAIAINSSPPPGTPGCSCSYVYAGAGLTNQSPPTAVALYEPATNHGGDGGNVVYADGHVEWHDSKSLAKIIAALNAGQNPPP